MPDEQIRLVHASGECEIDFARRELRVLGAPVPVGGRAFEVIEVLARSAGEIVTKNQLMDRIWPGAAVTENTLHVHAMAVRKALGPYRTLLKTESRRGYRLLGDWSVRPHDAARPPIGAQQMQLDGESPISNFPVPVTRLIGRTAAVTRLRDFMSAYRLVTLTGPGGIGKTSLALKAARGVVGEFANGGWLVELASLSDASLVPTSVARALRLPTGPSDVTPETIARSVGDKKLLLLLDNCEHLIEAVAALAETLLAHCPHATIMATSRETLGIQGEYVYRVPPLEVPAAGHDEAEHILTSSAVELFIARTKALDTGFAPRAGELAGIGAICRHLDGIPLAIEFAAARASTFGVGEVAAGLHDRFALLTIGRRTALPRHRTLRGVLDWSHELLPGTERHLLRHVAIFSGGFTIDAAGAVTEDGVIGRSAVTECIANLVAKSLVVLDRDTSSRWYLLETIRAYALEKLVESGEGQRVARRHAEFCLALFAPFGTPGRLQAAIDDLERYRAEVDNLRAALNWAFSDDGDAALGVALAAAAADFWAAASLLPEACEWAGKALARIADHAGSRHEMVLQCSLGLGLIYTRGMVAAARDVLKRGLALALEIGDFDYQQRAFHGLWLFSARSIALEDAFACARQYEEVSRGRDPHSQATADWLVGHTHLYLGEHRAASVRLQRAIDLYPVESRDRDMIRFVNDLRASAFGHLSVSLLSLGQLDAASRVARNAVEEARTTNQPIVLCIALTWAAGLVFLSLGDLATAERYSEELIDRAYKHGLAPFHAAGLCVRGSLLAKRDDPNASHDPLRRGLAVMQEASYLLFYPFFRAELAAALGAAGRIDDGQVEIDGAIRFAEQCDYRWFMPEMLRVKAQLLTLRDPDDPAAEDCLHRGLETARAQDALFWELRLAASLARLRIARNRPGEARHILMPVYDRFTEGFAAPDLRGAKALLDELPA